MPETAFDLTGMAALSLQNQLFGFPSLGSGGTIAAGFSKTPPLSPMISSSPGCKSPPTISVLAPSFRPSWTVIAIGFPSRRIQSCDELSGGALGLPEPFGRRDPEANSAAPDWARG